MFKATTSVKWHDRAYVARVKTEMNRRLDAAGEYLRGKIVRNISLPTSIYGPSKVGEYPHADSGKLRQSIYSRQTSPGVQEVGSPLPYAYHLETKGRSFIFRTFKEERPALRRIMLKPIPSRG